MSIRIAEKRVITKVEFLLEIGCAKCKETLVSIPIGESEHVIDLKEDSVVYECRNGCFSQDPFFGGRGI